MNWENLCLKVCELSRETGKFIQEEQSKLISNTIEEKSFNNFVTKVDKASEERLVSQLNKFLPEAGFIAEEGTSSERKELNWIIDPIDGTTNFIHGVPCYAISIALVDSNSTKLGVIYEINLDECFYSWGSGKCFLNEKEVRVSRANHLPKTLIATGFPYHDYGRLDKYMDLLKWFTQHTRGIRRLGSAATDLAYVACGRFDAFYEYGLSPWDVAAGAFLVEQAGGQSSDFKGGDDYLFGKEILSSNGILHQEFLKVIQTHF